MNPHTTLDELERQHRVFLAAREEAGLPAPEEIPALREVCVAPTDEEAMLLAGRHLAGKYAAYVDWGQSDVMPDGDTLRRAWEELTEGGRFIIGSPETAGRMLAEHAERAGISAPHLQDAVAGDGTGAGAALDATAGRGGAPRLGSEPGPPGLTVAEALLVLAAGVAAGTINVVVGSGTLITFPVLLAIRLPPVTANVSNTIGLVPGSFSGVVGYRRELATQRTAAAARRRLVPGGSWARSRCSCCRHPRSRRSSRSSSSSRSCSSSSSRGWRSDSPTARGARRRRRPGPTGLVRDRHLRRLLRRGPGDPAPRDPRPTLPEDLQHVNAIKNLLAMLVNLVSGIIFAFVAHVDWQAAALIAAGSIVGGALGARYGRRLPPQALRALIVVVGTVAIVRLLT